MEFVKAVVTGGAGFIGSYIVDRLAEMGVKEIVVIDNLSSGSLGNIERHLGKDYLRLVKADLKVWGEWVEEFRGADAVFHYAANPEVRISATEPRIHFEENLVATFNVLEASRRYDVELHVFASSSTVYGEASKIPTPEDYHPLNPISVYGAVKLGGEALYTAYSNLYGFKTLIARYANIIGPRSNHGVIVDFVRKLMRNPGELEILGDGTQRKSYLYVEEAVDATLHALGYTAEKGRNVEVFNIGNEDWVTVVEIADIVVEEMGLKGVRYRFRPATPDGRGWPGDVKLMLLDISRLKSIGWRPRISSREAVRLTARSVVQRFRASGSS